jgi:uncharacterized phage infection (PIP) family protein YhgE
LSIPSAAVDALVSLGDLAPRMQALEREMRAMHGSLEEGMAATEAGMKETATLQSVTNEGIGQLVKGVEPLGGGITQVEQNTAPLSGEIAALQNLMSSMLEELRTMRQSIERISEAAEPVARLRERLPGRS